MNDTFIKVREASRKFAAFACEEKINCVLLSLADALESSSDTILQANSADLARMDSKEMAIIESVNQHDKIVAVLSAVAAVGLAVVLIFGSSMLANFATTALIGVIINAAVAILVMPEMLNGSKKA